MDVFCVVMCCVIAAELTPTAQTAYQTALAHVSSSKPAGSGNATDSKHSVSAANHNKEEHNPSLAHASSKVALGMVHPMLFVCLCLLLALHSLSSAYSKTAGRFLRATSALAVGQVIINELPFAAVLNR